MNEVGTIRDTEVLKAFKREARKLGEEKYLLVELGLNTGLRISDLLQLRVRDIRENGFIVKREQKTGKQTVIEFHPAVVREIEKMIAGRGDDEYLFPSPWLSKRKEPVSYKTAYKWINRAARAAGIKGPVGCHTLRKTYGYHFYKTYNDIGILMAHFNHATEKITMRYIGITQERINAKTRKFRL